MKFPEIAGPEHRRFAALFISFERAWLAVKEFIERDGALPQAIEWIAVEDLPKHAFRPKLA